MHRPGPPSVIRVFFMVSFVYMADASQSHCITTPGYIFPGVNTTISVHLFGTIDSELNVTAEIRGLKNEFVQASKVFYRDTIGLLTIPPLPMTASSDFYQLAVFGSSHDTWIFLKIIVLPLKKRNRSVFVQTDKDVYKPGQTVKIRVISITHDLKPYNGQLDVTIKGLETNSHFTIVEDVLPKFEVILKVPSFYIQTKKLNLTGTVNAKHIFGKPIKGNVTVSLITVYFNMSEITETKTYKISGSVDFSFTAEGMLSLLNNSLIMITASVTEELTGIVAQASSLLHIIDSEYSLVLSSAPQETAQGLNFTAKLQVVRFDNSSLTQEERKKIVTVKIVQRTTEDIQGHNETDTNYFNTIECNYTIPESGIISIQFSIVFYVATIMIEAHYQNTTERWNLRDVRFPLTLPYYAEIKTSNSIKQVGEAFQVDVATNPQAQDMYYVVMAKGIIVAAGQSKNASFILTPEYSWAPKVTLIVYFFRKNEQVILKTNEILYIKGLFKNKVSLSWNKIVTRPSENISLNLNVSQFGSLVGLRMAEKKSPTVLNGNAFTAKRVENELVTYTEGTGYSLSDIQIDVINSPHETQVNLPGLSRSLRSIYSLALSEVLTYLRVKKYLSTKQILEHNDIMISRSLKFLNINEVIVKETPITNWELDVLFPSTSTRTDEIVLNLPRMEPFIPETWVWKETNVSSGVTNILQLTAPQTNSSWVADAFVISEEHGLGFTEESVELDVFENLFISLNLPYSITRGEQFILEVSLFNQLTRNMEATVKLEASDSFEIIIPNTDSSVPGLMDVAIRSQETKTVLFPIKPKHLGQISITVKANSSGTFYNTTKSIFVKAEEIKRFYSQAAVFDVVGTAGAAKTVVKMFPFTFLDDLVEGSEEAFITVNGDLLASSIDGLESLIHMPYGCGEQNMINFAPNIYVLHYLTEVQKLTEDIKLKAIGFMELGYQKELTYMRHDGSFSAFGDRDVSGSTWLSAFVLRCFLQARPFIFISQEVLDQTVQWLVQKQDINTGIFSEPGNVIHPELQSGLNGPVTLTAYILISLLEDEGYRKLYDVNIFRAVQYLESEFDEGISSNYTLSVVVYALTLANSTKAGAALTQLNSRANNIGNVMYWSSAPEKQNYWLPRSNDIETAAYALLSHCKQNRILDGVPIMKWLSQQRNSLGGYSTTQDTIMGLQALAQFLSIIPGSDTSLNITVTGSGSFVPTTFQINNDNLLVLQTQQISVSQPFSINVSAVGRGIAIFQLNINYNQKASSRNSRGIWPKNSLEPESFTLNMVVNEDPNNSERLSVDVCTSYQGTGNESGMALLDVGFLSGFSLDPKGIPLHGSLKMVETKEEKVYLYFDSVKKTNVCVSVPLVRVANVAGSQDAVVKILDYYNPSNMAIGTYNSATMSKISSCDFCGLNCSLCISNVLLKPPFSLQLNSPNTGSVQTTSPTSPLCGFLMLAIYYIFW
ncbi:CD109 antigen-like [Pelobates fuscus]|uniref:CD109 antigen-like n=1 Tax=Pelobates fuscus TaxID=191477 RepID=UPI002FE47ED8